MEQLLKDTMKVHVFARLDEDVLVPIMVDSRYHKHITGNRFIVHRVKATPDFCLQVQQTCELLL